MTECAATLKTHLCEKCGAFGPFGRKKSDGYVWRCAAHVWLDFFPKNRVAEGKIPLSDPRQGRLI